jgi:hypothetical protein
MVWEMYVTALDTVALAKVRKVWPEYVASNDLIILNVVREIENEKASISHGTPEWVAAVYTRRTRDAIVELKDVGTCCTRCLRVVEVGWRRRVGASLEVSSAV